MDEKTTLVVTAVPDPNEMESVQEYLKGVLPLLKGAGGKPVKRVKTDKLIHGNPNGMVLVMDFDSANAITAMFESDDYAALVPMRDRGFAEMNIQLSHEMWRDTTDCNPRGVGSDPHMVVFALVAPVAGGYQELRSSVFGACSRITWHRTDAQRG